MLTHTEWEEMLHNTQHELQQIHEATLYLNGKAFCTLKEAQVLLEQWRYHYNHFLHVHIVGKTTLYT